MRSIITGSTESPAPAEHLSQNRIECFFDLFFSFEMIEFECASTFPRMTLGSSSIGHSSCTHSHFLIIFCPHWCWVYCFEALYLRQYLHYASITGRSWFATVHSPLSRIDIWTHVCSSTSSLAVSHPSAVLALSCLKGNWCIQQVVPVSCQDLKNEWHWSNL